MPVSIAPELAWYDATTSDDHFPNPKLSNPGLLTQSPKVVQQSPRCTLHYINPKSQATDLVQMIWCNLELTSTNFLEGWSLWKGDHFGRMITLEGWSLWKGDHLPKFLSRRVAQLQASSSKLSWEQVDFPSRSATAAAAGDKRRSRQTEKQLTELIG